MIPYLHRFIRRVAALAMVSFYSEIRLVGEENVPEKGPIIVVSSHHNMMVDPVVLSSTFPHKRILHYWSKSSLFTNPIAASFFKATGNIPVDRKNKDKAKLFKGTFDVLATGEAVAVFPEGTSYTECRIMQVKDGAAWAALEYMKWARNSGKESYLPPQIVVVGITYTDKSTFRSSVIVEYGKSISMDAFAEQFLSGEEGTPRAAAKRLNKCIEQQMIELTINAPNWETLFMARIARDLLWPDSRSINSDHFVAISQTLVDLFSSVDSSHDQLKSLLLSYHSLLQSSRFTNSDLSSLPLPSSLDPKQVISTPTRLMTLFFLVRDTIAASFRLPFFLFPFIIHLPAYLMGRYGAKLAEDEEETRAQNKIVFGIALCLVIYSILFGILWTFLKRTAVGALIAAGSIWAISIYHRKMIDDNYFHAKRLVAAWRVLVGVWIPKRFDISASGLELYVKPFIPPISPYIGRARSDTSELPRLRPRGPPSRRLVRHVLRARIEAAKALFSFLIELERSGERVRASSHLARVFGGVVDDYNIELSGDVNDLDSVKDGVLPVPTLKGWRSSKEVVHFLLSQGANVKLLQESSQNEDNWALVSSEGESRDSDN